MNTMQTNPQDILKTLSLSFEVFPPKKWEDFPGLYETLDELKGLHPEFISCTYGAGGSNSKKTAEIASHIENELGIFYGDYKYQNIAHREMSILKDLPNVLMLPHMAFYTETAMDRLSTRLNSSHRL